MARGIPELYCGLLKTSMVDSSETRCRSGIEYVLSLWSVWMAHQTLATLSSKRPRGNGKMRWMLCVRRSVPYQDLWTSSLGSRWWNGQWRLQSSIQQHPEETALHSQVLGKRLLSSSDAEGPWSLPLLSTNQRNLHRTLLYPALESEPLWWYLCVRCPRSNRKRRHWSDFSVSPTKPLWIHCN